MDEFDNQIQDPEVSSVQEAQEQWQAQELAEAVDLAGLLFDMLRVTSDQVHAVTSSTRGLEGDLQQEQEVINACDHRIATMQEECARVNERLVEINSQVDYWQGKLNNCIAELNNQHQQNRAAQMRENTIMALIEEERQLIAEFRSHGYSVVTPNPM
ncbi:hypothetical protein MSG28_006354 [Choristoneura fumiferana]|uniref:Uncharacterized protein n=1 Tax=Choristoneura fumiferana TaxID=7141 RepID=A0ACC0JEQ4_CHOFU|nr:hypothetical protein MSG28_006354 [Choristoneura fumiferana]